MIDVQAEQAAVLTPLPFLQKLCCMRQIFPLFFCKTVGEGDKESQRQHLGLRDKIGTFWGLFLNLSGTLSNTELVPTVTKYGTADDTKSPLWDSFRNSGTSQPDFNPDMFL